jgi:trigger factor
MTEQKLRPAMQPSVELEEGGPGKDAVVKVEVETLPDVPEAEIEGLRIERLGVETTDAMLDDAANALAAGQKSFDPAPAARKAAKGDRVLIDYEGKVDGEPFEGGEARGHLVELGAGRLIPGFEEQLEGAAAGDGREVKVTFPDDYQAEQLAGKDASFAVDVKEVKEKRLPELDDDFAEQAGGFDSLDELRAEVEERIGQAEERRIEGEFREAAVDAAVATSTIEIPHELVHAKAHDMWHRTARRMAQQGIDPQQYLTMTGKTEEELVTEAEPDAEQALKREAVLAEIVKAEGIEVSDEEIATALREAAGPDASDKQLKRALKRARKQGAEDALRDDIAMRKAVDLLVESAKPIPVEQAAAREKLWTPEKERPAEGASELWTPGS